ncbi:MAG: DNA ligase D [Chthonomonas sp.]|nr:DNA ligase D [Chthonomonas sp.]
MPPLDEYVRKRNFDRTPEPTDSSFAEPAEHLRFVIQLHHATNLHYDFRLECGGVLLSWAVPKGPSLNPDDKKLAVRVEDHPLAYGDFEGAIPKDQYGGGEVIIWDTGDIYPEADDGTTELDREKGDALLAQQLKDGKISVTLRGYKLRGSFALVKTSGGPNHWLLLKHRDEFACDFDILALPGSVRSRQESARYLKPMLLQELTKTIGDDVAKFGGDDWTFEIKLDGVRCIAVRNYQQVDLFTRNGANLSAAFPHLVEALRRLPAETFVLDGEIVYYDERGAPNFATLMQYINRSSAGRSLANIEFCVFDMLQSNHESLLNLPLGERIARLDQWAFRSPLRRMDPLPGPSDVAFKLAMQFGFEGVVGKRLSSRYQPGVRTPDWLKVKSYLSGEFVVVGYAFGERGRASSIGSLLLAEEAEDGQLRYVGSVGTGFTEEKLQELRGILDEAKIVEPVIPCDKEKQFQAVEPRLWVEVRFMDWGPNQHLRQPVFLRERQDRMLKVEQLSRETILIDQLGSGVTETTLQYGNFQLPVTKLNKVNWPGDTPATKGMYLSYFARIWPLAQRHFAGRPLTLIRFPDGIDTPGVYQKHFQHEPPDYVQQVEIWSDTNEQATKFVMVNNLETLLWLAQMGMLELHAWYSSVQPVGKRSRDFATSRANLEQSVLNYPDFIVFDLDPPGKSVAGFEMVKEGAAFLHEVLVGIGMTPFIKTSGRSGLHVYVPIVRNLDFAATKGIAQMLATHVTQLRPDLFTIEWSKEKRPDKVYFDYNQNGRGRTLPAPYSVRAVPNAPVSMPILWEDLSLCHPGRFTIKSILNAERDLIDPWENIFQSRVDVEAVLAP